MGLIDDCERYFHSKSLYDVLNVEKTATAAQLKQGYRRLSLLIHPDKASEDNREECTRKFQILTKVHYILSDAERRQLYDESGIVDDENTSLDDTSLEFWKNYWRTLFPKITINDVEKFFSSYKGSDEEREDLKKSYLSAKGDMNLISETFVGYSVEEEDRFIAILKDMIKEKEVPSYPKFKNETAAKRAARRKKQTQEVAESEELLNSLATAMQARSAQREDGFNDMISRLEAKYAKKDTGKKKVKK